MALRGNQNISYIRSPKRGNRREREEKGRRRRRGREREEKEKRRGREEPKGMELMNFVWDYVYFDHGRNFYG